MTQSVKSFESDPFLLLCSECNGPIITDNYRGETLCEACGLIHSEKACDTANLGKRMFSIQDVNRKSTHGDPQTVFTLDIGLSTFIDAKGLFDSNFKRIRKNDYWFKSDSRSKLIRIAILDLKRISSNLKIPLSIAGQGLYLYKKAHKRRLIQGRDSISFVCSCLYYACRKYELPITLTDIVKETETTIRKVKNAYRVLYRTFNLKVKPLTPQHFVSRYINELGLGLPIEKQVLEVLQQLPYNFINGQNPRKICGGAIYFVGKLNNQKRLQRDIAKVCDVSEASIRDAYKKLIKLVKI